MTSRVYFPFLTNFKVYRISAIGDGSCFFHALLLGFVIPYIEEKYEDGSKFNRVEFTKKFRKIIANTLYQKDDSGKILYDKLANGNLKDLAKHGGFGEKYKLSNFYEWLKSSRSVGLEAIEVTSRYIKRNILILSVNNSDVYKIGTVGDTYNPKLPSIVLLYTQNITGDDGHFDLCGIRKDGKIITHFSPKNDFIREILNRNLNLEH